MYIVTLLIYLYAECIMRNAGLEETQAGIKIAARNINNLRYADDMCCEIKTCAFSKFILSIKISFTSP